MFPFKNFLKLCLYFDRFINRFYTAILTKFLTMRSPETKSLLSVCVLYDKTQKYCTLYSLLLEPYKCSHILLIEMMIFYPFQLNTFKIPQIKGRLRN